MMCIIKQWGKTDDKNGFAFGTEAGLAVTPTEVCLLGGKLHSFLIETDSKQLSHSILGIS